jgi:hypothetical protein
MSVFNVFLSSTDTSFDSQFKATGNAAALYNNYRSEDHPKQTFEAFVIGLVSSGSFFVTYKDNSQQVITDGAKLYYYPGGNTGVSRKEIKLDGIQDKASQDKVNMIVPSAPIDVASSYLQEAIQSGFMGGYTIDQKMSFLMGMLLLKRCR